MHYLTFGADYAIVEDDAQAAKHVAAGWTLTTLDAVRARWRERDMARLDVLHRACATETAPLQGGAIATRMKDGTLYIQGKKAE